MIADPASPGYVPAAASRHGDGKAYRRDIDGLRAIAVLSVVLFHAGLFPFRSGFVGVDIFFVISGYLIGGIILHSAIRKNFSFATFYARRARRILPALIAVVLIFCAAGWFILSGPEFHDVGSTSLFALLGSSNFSFWKNQDYFNPDAHLKPLLMTWSLGVEEQFYLFFPILLLAVARWQPRHIFKTIAILTAVSLVFSVWCTWAWPVTAFYLLPARAWELGAGVLLASWAINREAAGKAVLAPAWRNLLGFAGLAALVISITCFNDKMPFPGFIALLPVGGACAMIAAEGSWVNRRLLSARAIVFIGLVSYSWYLWHWPLMSYTRIVAVNTPPVWMMTAVAAVSFGLAVLSWKFIEQPFRATKLVPKRQLMQYGLALGATLAVVASVKLSDGFPHRLPPEVLHVQSIMAAGRGNCLANWAQNAPDLSPACVTQVNGRPSIAIIGDSHASALGPALRRIGERDHAGIAILTKSSCGPTLGVALTKQDMPFFAQACKDFVRQAVQFTLQRPDIKTVILAGNWISYAPLGGDQLYKGLRDTISTLQAAGKAVVLVGDVPVYTIDPVHAVFAGDMKIRGDLARFLWKDKAGFPDAGVSASITAEAPEIGRALQAVVADKAVRYLDLHQKFCSAEGCSFLRNGDLYYIDRQHLSAAGANFALDGLDFKGD